MFQLCVENFCRNKSLPEQKMHFPWEWRRFAQSRTTAVHIWLTTRSVVSHSRYGRPQTSPLVLIFLGLMSLHCSFLWPSPRLPRPFGDCGHFYYEHYSSLCSQTAVCSSACVAPWLPLISTKLEYGHKIYWTLTLQPCPVEQASVPLRSDFNPPSWHPEASLIKFLLLCPSGVSPETEGLFSDCLEGTTLLQFSDVLCV